MENATKVIVITIGKDRSEIISTLGQFETIKALQEALESVSESEKEVN